MYEVKDEIYEPETDEADTTTPTSTTVNTEQQVKEETVTTDGDGGPAVADVKGYLVCLFIKLIHLTNF